jgi:hypothetical protein
LLAVFAPVSGNQTDLTAAEFAAVPMFGVE